MNPILHALPVMGILAVSAAAQNTTFTLARELMAEDQYPLAAVEFRRWAMETDVPSEQASAYLYAGYSYLKIRQSDAAAEMIDRAESTDEDSRYASEIALLNAENAYRSNDRDSALYFYDILAEDAARQDLRDFSLRRAATIHLTQGNLDASRERLDLLHRQDDAAACMQALETYAEGKDKNPMIGGLLGLIPGVGYWYSGEIANGFRSLILNSLFMYGMVDTAQDDQWGAFAVITFFELTWYSGSVYGGIDAAHRHNQDRLESAVQAIEHGLAFRPDSAVTIPLFKLDVEF